MRCTTKEIAASRLRELGFPGVLEDIIQGRHRKLARSFDIYFGSPSEFFRLIAERPEDMPVPDQLIPIHESNGEFFVCYAAAPHDVFLEHSIERDPDRPRVIAKNYQGYVAYELIRLIGDGLELDELQEYAIALCFDHLGLFESAYAALEAHEWKNQDEILQQFQIQVELAARP